MIAQLDKLDENVLNCILGRGDCMICKICLDKITFKKRKQAAGQIPAPPKKNDG
jgi:hypothetical protein